jgi:hypothetical protein
VIIKKWWWEPGVTPSREMRSALQHCFARFLRFLGSQGLRIDADTAGASDLGWLASTE